MKWAMRLKIGWAIFGILAGLSAAPMFFYMYQNYLAASLAAFSCVCAIYLVYTHWAYHKRWLISWSKAQTRVVVFVNGCISAAALGSMFVFLVLAEVKHQNLLDKGNNLWIAAVWCWMTSKWTMMSAIYTWRYAQNVMQPLLVYSDDT